MTDVLRKLGARRAGKTPLICANREGIKKHFLPVLAGGYEVLQDEGDHLGSIPTLEGGARGLGAVGEAFCRVAGGFPGLAGPGPRPLGPCHPRHGSEKRRGPAEPTLRMGFAKAACFFFFFNP